jgi:hypothetical protein
MHLSGITAEDRSGAQKHQAPEKPFAASAPVFSIPEVELAKGFEPPTL